MCFNLEGAISTLNGDPLKLVDNFMYFGSSVPSPESDVSIHLAKVWTSIVRLSIMLKFDLYDKIKWDFFQAVIVFILFALGMHHMDADKTHRDKVRWDLHKNATSYIEQILEATPHETTAVWSLTSHF